MRKPHLEISYWTDPEGEDFEGFQEVVDELVTDYDVSITRERTDAMGGGLYELIIQINNNIDFSEVLKFLAEEGASATLGYFGKIIIEKLKNLFTKNKKLEPGIACAKIIFLDIEIIIHSLYDGSISEVMDKIVQSLTKHFLTIRKGTNSPIKSIHIPIFNRVDTYNVCAYRVKLNVDENIPSFGQDDYFKLWGIRCEDGGQFVYDLGGESLLNVNFYTQEEYDVLLDEKLNSEK